MVVTAEDEMIWTEHRDAALGSRIQTALASAIQDKRIVGGLVRVARDGALVAHHAVGFADRESRRPMTENTPFRLASLLCDQIGNGMRL